MPPMPRTGAADFAASLRDQGFLADALRFMAAAMPKRKAVWWACRCVRHGAVGEFPAEDLLKFVSTWLDTAFEGGRHARRIGKIEALDD